MSKPPVFHFTPETNLTKTEGQLMEAFLERYDRLLKHWNNFNDIVAAIEENLASTPSGLGSANVEFDNFEDVKRPTRPPSKSVRRRDAKTRAKAFAQRMIRKAGVQHLSAQDIEDLSSSIPKVKLKSHLSEHRIDEIAAKLYEDLPWMRTAIEPIWRELRLRASQKKPIGFGPILLDGPPSIGKTYFAQSLAGLLSLPTLSVDVGQTPEGFKVSGMARNWSNATPSAILQMILNTSVANPVIIIDEIDKYGTIRNSKGAPYQIVNALLGLMEPTSNSAWSCPYYGVKFDMSHISWIATSNDARVLPPPLLSRMRVISLPELSEDDLLEFASRLVDRVGLSSEDEDVIERVILEAPDGHPNKTLRGIKRMTDDLQAMASVPLLN